MLIYVNVACIVKLLPKVMNVTLKVDIKWKERKVCDSVEILNTPRESKKNGYEYYD